MPFEKGNSLGKGRPKGSQNKETKRIRLMIDEYLNGNMETFQDKLNSLSPKDYVSSYLSLMEYSVPKLQRTELTDGEGNQFTLIVKNATGNTGDT